VFFDVVTCRVRTCANNKRAKQIVKLIKIAGFVRFFKLSSKVQNVGVSMRFREEGGKPLAT